MISSGCIKSARKLCRSFCSWLLAVLSFLNVTLIFGVLLVFPAGVVMVLILLLLPLLLTTLMVPGRALLLLLLLPVTPVVTAETAGFIPCAWNKNITKQKHSHTFLGFHTTVAEDSVFCDTTLFPLVTRSKCFEATHSSFLDILTLQDKTTTLLQNIKIQLSTNIVSIPRRMES